MMSVYKWSWNYKGNRLNNDNNKETFKKDLMNLIEINYQINMSFDHVVSSNNSFKIHLSFNIFLTL